MAGIVWPLDPIQRIAGGFTFQSYPLRTSRWRFYQLCRTGIHHFILADRWAERVSHLYIYVLPADRVGEDEARILSERPGAVGVEDGMDFH